MAKPGIEVVGSRELRKALRAAAGDLDDLKAAHAAAAAVVETRATAEVPRRSGRLASSIRSSGQAAGGVVRSGKASVPYAGPIHFGWRAHNIEPNPFLYDALDAKRAEVIETYETAIDKIKKTHDL